MFIAKKSLGQHFLKDENICKKIVESFFSIPQTHALEIGPGYGAITKFLIENKNIDLKLVEIDKEKIEFLKITYPSLQEKIIDSDILKIDKPFNHKFAVVGNFPYNISSQIVFKLLAWHDSIDGIVGMFQKEMAMRIVAKPGNKTYGVISVLAQSYFNIEYLFDISAQCFSPPPKVTSAVIKFLPATQIPNFSSYKNFSLLVKTGFGQRRKMLRNAVSNLFEKDVLQENIFTKRIEQLSIDEIAELTHKMKDAKEE